MPDNLIQQRLPLLQTLLTPIQKILYEVLPDFAQHDLKKKEARNVVVQAADAVLVRQFPIARLLPPERRQKLIRAQLDLILDEVLLNDSMPKGDVSPSFRSFIATVSPFTKAPSEAVMRATRNILGGDWTVSPLPIDMLTFELTADHPQLSVKEAWNRAYQLGLEPDISHVEPNLIVPLENTEPDEGAALGLNGFFGKKPLPASADPEWSVNLIHAKEAWLHAETNGHTSRGEGILIGHPDTGYTRHVENWNDDPAKRRLLAGLGWDFWKNDADATDDLESAFGSIFTAGFIGNPGHGTGTSSVIFSDEGPRTKKKYVTGIAPSARLIPYRVAPTVVVWDRARLADAIIRATDAGCHVLSISMGGLPLDYLQRAVRYAVSKGVIVCCAAGNIYGANDILHGVVWPANYPEALAVAASNANDEPWSGSSRGPGVDITAPGESVWHAIAEKGKPLVAVDRGNGTSFAVATMAGVAALWLAYHERGKLIAAYGPGQISSVFQHLLGTRGFRKISNWKTSLFGPGIVDALKMLQAPLPSPSTMASKLSVSRQSKFDQIASLFDDVPRSDLRRGLASLLHTTDSLLSKQLDDLGDELLFHFYSDGKMRRDFRAQIKGSKGRQVAAKTAIPSATELSKAVPQSMLAAMASRRLRNRLIGS